MNLTFHVLKKSQHLHCYEYFHLSLYYFQNELRPCQLFCLVTLNLQIIGWSVHYTNNTKATVCRFLCDFQIMKYEMYHPEFIQTTNKHVGRVEVVVTANNTI